MLREDILTARGEAKTTEKVRRAAKMARRDMRGMLARGAERGGGASLRHTGRLEAFYMSRTRPDIDKAPAVVAIVASAPLLQQFHDILKPYGKRNAFWDS